MSQPIGIILTSVGDASIAKTLARRLIDAELAACVQISAAGTSIYRWEGCVQEDAEYYLCIKSPRTSCNDIIAWLEQHHPYNTPEIIMLEAQAAQAYADWAKQAVTAPGNMTAKDTPHA